VAPRGGAPRRLVRSPPRRNPLPRLAITDSLSEIQRLDLAIAEVAPDSS
jgi:hypothetical protein